MGDKCSAGLHSDSEKNMSAYADQNHAPSLAAARLKICLQSRIDYLGGTLIAHGELLQCLRISMEIGRAHV